MTRMCRFIPSVTYTAWSRNTFWFLAQRNPCLTHWWTFLCKAKHKNELIVRIPWLYGIVAFNFKSTMWHKIWSTVTIEMWRVWGRGEVCTGFWWENLRERDHWGDPDVDRRILLRWIFRKWEGVVETGWSWLRIGTGGGHLWVRWWTFGFRKMRGISWLVAEPVSSSRRTLLHE
jgi:hypothetical protein